jgi:putative nucleotidyltransferase with HDIG domain
LFWRRLVVTVFDSIKSGKFLAIAFQPHSPKRKHRSRHSFQLPLLFIIAVILLTSAIGYRFYNDPQLAVGTIAPQTLRAPESVEIEDIKTTEENRKAARTGAIPVLVIDSSVNQEIYQSLQRLLDQGDELREDAGPFPFIETYSLSTEVQRYLRQASDTDWQSIVNDVDQIQVTTPPKPPDVPAPNPVLPPDVSTSHRLAVMELYNYRLTHTREDFAALQQAIERSRQRYQGAIARLSPGTTNEPAAFYDLSLLELTDEAWEATKTGIRQTLERILLQGIPAGLSEPTLHQAIDAQMQASDIPGAATSLATKVLREVVQPNLVEDPEQTRLQAEQAAERVEPVMVSIRRGEIIVRSGETISQPDFVLLDHFGLSRRGINWPGLVGFGTWVTVAVSIFLLVERRFHPGLRRRDYVLLLILSLSTVPVAVGFPTTSLPLIGLLAGSFYGSILGTSLIGLLGITLQVGMEISSNHLIASIVSSLFGAFMAGRLRSREELALLGCGVGLIQATVYLLISLILNTGNPVWYGVLTSAGIQGLLGITWSVLALGVSPYLEHMFDLVTPVRLAELSNPNRPLLKRLASEAPGTFQHTLFVASLAEAAARALRCNVELVRAGTLYHDIGKMHDAQGFIENQMGGPNKHDEIDDPWISAKIIKKHVTEGLVMARRCRLPRAIRAFIPEHQGTMLISYFYYEAQKRAQDDPKLVVDETDFRYDGPIPQSRETGIVMLADSCEAALRSLKDATPEEALAMVNRILRARWQDQQLVDSGLNRDEMTTIAEIFVQVWKQFNHQRIAYPKAPLPVQASRV